MTKHDQPTPARTSETYVQNNALQKIRIAPARFGDGIDVDLYEKDGGVWVHAYGIPVSARHVSAFVDAVNRASLTQSASLPQQGQGESGTVTVTREYRDAMLKEREQYREMCVLMRGYFESLRDVLATGYDHRAFSKVQMRAHLYAMNLVELLDGVTPEEAFKWWNTPWHNHGAAPVPPQAHAVAAPVPASNSTNKETP